MRNKLYWLLVAGLTLSLFWAFAQLATPPTGHDEQVHKLLLAGVSAFMNVCVLYYHASHVPHPKFIMNPIRRATLVIHVGAGCMELFSCLVAYATGDVRWAIGAAWVAVLGHIPTAYYQTATVFGTRAVMVASYLFAISLHLFCAVHLLREPVSAHWLLNMFLALNTYVWVRVFYYLFARAGVFTASIYSVSVLMAVLLLFPAVLGVLGNLLFMSYVLASIFLYYAVVNPSQPLRVAFLREHERDMLIPANALVARSQTPQQPTDLARARFVFDQLDKNQNNYLDTAALQALLMQWGLPPHELTIYLRPYPQKRIGFEEFVTDMRPLWQFAYANLSVNYERNDYLCPTK